jgi:ribosomal protein S18 acetylase RimI-like enzyme
MTVLEQVQTAISGAEYPNRNLIDQGPFRILIDPIRSVLYVNYALVLSASESPVDDVARMMETFKAHKRVPRVEYVHEAAPGLDTALEHAGFKREHELPMMTCTLSSFRPRLAEGVDVRMLGLEDDVRLYYHTANQAFDVKLPVGDTPRPKGEADKQTGTLHIAIGYIGGEPAGCACLGPTWELSGVGVVPSFRRRGVASSVSSALLAEHFERHSIAWLTAEDERAESVYRGLGFEKAGTHLSYAMVPQALE